MTTAADTNEAPSRWEIVQRARHPQRPTSLDFIDSLCADFVELHGDRAVGDDPAIIGGPARFRGRAVMVIAHARGRSPAEQEARRLGMPQPEGFRKAIRLVRLAERLGLPVLTFVDTPGAHPGPDAETRGQAMLIAECLEAFASCRTPVVAALVGEGGSGGALALSVADRILAMEYSYFAVISPEACSSILFRDGSHAAETAEALKPTARDLLAQGLVDEVVPEPAGGAHRDPAQAIRTLGDSLDRTLAALEALAADVRGTQRRARLRSFGEPAYGRA